MCETYNHLRTTVFYCAWGMDYKKETDLWICRNNERAEFAANRPGTHRVHAEHAQRCGKRTRHTAQELGTIPEELVRALLAL